MEDRDLWVMFEGFMQSFALVGQPEKPQPESNDAVTFEALNFVSHANGWFGVHAKTEYPNGYGASVVRGRLSYGGRDGHYEVAVMKEGNVCYDTPITDDVIGHLTPAKVTRLLKRIAKLPVAKDDAALCEICEKPLDGVGVIEKHYEGPVHAHCASRSSL